MKKPIMIMCPDGVEREFRFDKHAFDGMSQEEIDEVSGLIEKAIESGNFFENATPMTEADFEELRRNNPAAYERMIRGESDEPTEH